MWHDQGEWVTCRQYSILTFWYKSLVHLNATFWFNLHVNRTSGYRDMNNSVKFKNNVKHKNLSLKFNIPDIRLIPLDHVTNVMQYNKRGNFAGEVRLEFCIWYIRVFFSALKGHIIYQESKHSNFTIKKSSKKNFAFILWMFSSISKKVHSCKVPLSMCCIINVHHFRHYTTLRS